MKNDKQTPLQNFKNNSAAKAITEPKPDINTPKPKDSDNAHEDSSLEPKIQQSLQGVKQ